MKVIRLTGADTYASERTYGFVLRRNQTIKLRDADANRILQSTQSGVALFTLTSLSAATFDASERYNGDEPVVYDQREALFLAGEDRKIKIPASVSGDGILGNGGRGLTYDGDAIPDPRRRASVFGQFATQSTSSGYIDPEYTRRIVVTQDISATTSGVTASGGQDLTLFSTAATAGFRWDEPNRPFRSCLSQANNSLAVITIREA